MADAPGNEANRVSWLNTLRSCTGTAADRKNRYRFLVWAMAWAATFLGADWGLENHDVQGPTAIFIAMIPTLMACGALWAYLRFLRETDELVRRIQLEGVALGFGAGIIFLLSLVSLEDAGFAKLDASDAIALMLVTWAFGQLFATWRYR
ncbi:MAG: hypothetical protein OEM63_01690 [Gammaproteobacteria bacterium]|nr:hypothetical protein [Gammaproteobacteria bacterium]